MLLLTEYHMKYIYPTIPLLEYYDNDILYVPIDSMMEKQNQEITSLKQMMHVQHKEITSLKQMMQTQNKEIVALQHQEMEVQRRAGLGAGLGNNDDLGRRKCMKIKSFKHGRECNCETSSIQALVLKAHN